MGEDVWASHEHTCRNSKRGWVWWTALRIPALGGGVGGEAEDPQPELEASLGYALEPAMWREHVLSPLSFVDP